MSKINNQKTFGFMLSWKIFFLSLSYFFKIQWPFLHFYPSSSSLGNFLSIMSSNFAYSRSSLRPPIKATDVYIKGINVVKCRCNNGQQGRILEVRVSDLSTNPIRLYYKYKACSFFSWVKEEDLTRYEGQRFMREAYGGQMSTQIETKLMIQRKQFSQ